MIEDDDLNAEQRGALSELKTARGPCPSADALLEYQFVPAFDRPRYYWHDHIQVCSRCQLALLHTTDRSAAIVGTVNTYRQWRLAVLLPIAALLIVGVAVTLVFRSPTTLTPVQLETVRGAELQPLRPIGNVETLTEFSWESPIRVDFYEVRVTRGSDYVWSGGTNGSKIDAPSGVFEPDVEYQWTVAAMVRANRSGDVVQARMTSPPQKFTLSRRR